jgi:hypothetical protein
MAHSGVAGQPSRRPSAKVRVRDHAQPGCPRFRVELCVTHRDLRTDCRAAARTRLLLLGRT